MKIQTNTVESETRKWSEEYLNKLENHSNALAVNLPENSESVNRLKGYAVLNLPDRIENTATLLQCNCCRGIVASVSIGGTVTKQRLLYSLLFRCRCVATGLHAIICILKTLQIMYNKYGGKKLVDVVFKFYLCVYLFYLCPKTLVLEFCPFPFILSLLFHNIPSLHYSSSFFFLVSWGVVRQSTWHVGH
jgi:hypothetical protein